MVVSTSNLVEIIPFSGEATRGRKQLQMLSDVISKSYERLKREVEDRSWWKKRAS